MSEAIIVFSAVVIAVGIARLILVRGRLASIERTLHRVDPNNWGDPDRGEGGPR